LSDTKKGVLPAPAVVFTSRNLVSPLAANERIS
jgi:hypothetical protein